MTYPLRVDFVDSENRSLRKTIDDQDIELRQLRREKSAAAEDAANKEVLIAQLKVSRGLRVLGCVHCLHPALVELKTFYLCCTVQARQHDSQVLKYTRRK